jgi:hypothetical protein
MSWNPALEPGCPDTIGLDIYWNFISSSLERLDEAKRQWRRGDWGQGMFDLPPGDRDEFIPLPT